MIRCKAVNSPPPGTSRIRIDRRTESVLVLVALFALVPRDAFAYIDPGTGSLIYQTALAAMLGAGILFRRVWIKLGSAVLRFFRRDTTRTPQDSQPPQ